jgi:hypothetical protein
MANVCIQMCESMYQIPSRALCFLIILLQGSILDYYLISHKTVYWYGWIAADIAILFVFIVTFIISYRHLVLVRHLSNSAGSCAKSLNMIATLATKATEYTNQAK